MAREFDSALSQYLEDGAVAVAAPPLAMVCWFNSNDIVNAYCFMSLCGAASDVNNIALYAQGAVGGDPLRLQMNDGGGWAIADTTAGFAAGTWHHACGIWVGNLERRVLIDGANKGVNTDAANPTVNRTGIGVMCRATRVSFFDGLVAEAAVYDLSVWPGATDSDKADNFEKILPSLAAGYSPRFYTLGLVGYWPLYRDDIDIVGGRDLTPFNGPTVIAHPRIILPVTPQVTTAGRRLAKCGKLQSLPGLTGQLKSEPKLEGQLKSEPKVTGIFGTPICSED